MFLASQLRFNLSCSSSSSSASLSLALCDTQFALRCSSPVVHVTQALLSLPLSLSHALSPARDQTVLREALSESSIAGMLHLHRFAPVSRFLGNIIFSYTCFSRTGVSCGLSVSVSLLLFFFILHFFSFCLFFLSHTHS